MTGLRGHLPNHEGRRVLLVARDGTRVVGILERRTDRSLTIREDSGALVKVGIEAVRYCRYTRGGK